MQFHYLLSALIAGVALAAPAPGEAAAAAVGLAPRACLPASCASFGVSSFIMSKICREIYTNVVINVVLLRRLRLLVCKSYIQ